MTGVGIELSQTLVWTAKEVLSRKFANTRFTKALTQSLMDYFAVAKSQPTPGTLVIGRISFWLSHPGLMGLSQHRSGKDASKLAREGMNAGFDDSEHLTSALLCLRLPMNVVVGGTQPGTPWSG